MTPFADWLATQQQPAGAHPSHRSKGWGDEWYTPQPIIDAAREVMGSIDIDPASCAEAQERVRARVYFTKDTDGLAHPWFGKVWCNPPYGRKPMNRFVYKLVREVQSGRTSEAVLLTNDSTETGWYQHALAHSAAVCLHEGRIGFIRPTGRTHKLMQGQSLFYFGERPERFAAVFDRFGTVVRRSWEVFKTGVNQ